MVFIFYEKKTCQIFICQFLWKPHIPFLKFHNYASFYHNLQHNIPIHWRFRFISWLNVKKLKEYEHGSHRSDHIWGSQKTCDIFVLVTSSIEDFLYRICFVQKVQESGRAECSSHSGKAKVPVGHFTINCGAQQGWCVWK